MNLARSHKWIAIMVAAILYSSLLLESIADAAKENSILDSNVLEEFDLGPYKIEIMGSRFIGENEDYDGFYGIKITNSKPKPPDKVGLRNAYSNEEYHYPEIIKIYLAYPDGKSSISKMDIDLIKDGNFKTIDYSKTLENTKLLDEEMGLVVDTIISCIPLGPLASASVAAATRIFGLAQEAIDQYPDQDVFYNDDQYDIRRIVLPHQVWLKEAGFFEGVFIDQGCFPGYFIKFDKGFESADIYYWIAIRDHSNMEEGVEWFSTNGKIIKAEVKEKSAVDDDEIRPGIAGQITSVTWPTKAAYSRNETIPITVEFTNTGSQAQSFWVGYSVQDSNAKWWDAPAQQAQAIQSGKSSSLELQWQPPQAAPNGTYNATVALWKSYNSATGLMEGELDRTSKDNAFEINSIDTSRAYPLTIHTKDIYDQVEPIPFTVEVKNLDSNIHSFFVDYYVYGEDTCGCTYGYLDQTPPIKPQESVSMQLKWEPPSSDWFLGRYSVMVNIYDKNRTYLQKLHSGFQINSSYGYWNYKGRAHYYLGQYDEAIEAYDEAIRVNPLPPHSWYDKGDALFKLGRYGEALQAYDEAIRIIEALDLYYSPRFPDAWYKRGEVLKALGRLKEAEEAFEKAMEIDLSLQRT